MKKLESLEELVKAAGHLASHFKARAAHHTAKAAAHESSVTEHTEMEAFHKGMHDGLDDGHADKAYHKRMSEHHAQRKAHHGTLHKLHKDMAARDEEMAGHYGEEKAAAAGSVAKTTPPAEPVAGGIEGMVAETTKGLVAKSLEMLQTDPTVQDQIRKMVLDGVKSALGDKIIPDATRGVTPSSAPDGVRLIPRGTGAPIEKTKVDASHEDMLLM